MGNGLSMCAWRPKRVAPRPVPTRPVVIETLDSVAAARDTCAAVALPPPPVDAMPGATPPPPQADAVSESALAVPPPPSELWVTPTDPLVTAAAAAVWQYRAAYDQAPSQNDRDAWAVAMLHDANFRVRMCINMIAVPGELRPPGGVFYDALIVALNDPCDYVRCMACIALSNHFCASAAVVGLMGPWLRDGSEEIRLAAAKALTTFYEAGQLLPFDDTQQLLADYIASVAESAEGSRFATLTQHPDGPIMMDLRLIPGYADGFILSFLDVCGTMEPGPAP